MGRERSSALVEIKAGGEVEVDGAAAVDVVSKERALVGGNGDVGSMTASGASGNELTSFVMDGEGEGR